MPRMNGTGPMGQGAMTGRGRGNCQSGERMFWCGRRLGANSRRASSSPKDQLAILEEEDKMLTEELEAIKAEKKALGDEK